MQRLSIPEQQLTELTVSVESIINNSLAVLELKVEESKEEFLPYLPVGERDRAGRCFAEMKQELQLIHSALSVLVNVMKHSKYSAYPGLSQRHPEEILMEHLQFRRENERE